MYSVFSRLYITADPNYGPVLGTLEIRTLKFGALGYLRAPSHKLFLGPKVTIQEVLPGLSILITLLECIHPNNPINPQPMLSKGAPMF